NNNFNANDSVDGGPGDDFLEVSGDFSAGLTLTPNVIKNIEQLTIDDNGLPVRLTTTDAAVGANGMEVVVPDNSPLNFNGSAETTDGLTVTGVSAHDVIRTGGGKDWLEGRGGADHLRGGAGKDYYAFDTPSDSTSTHYHTIVGFDVHKDTFVFFDAP